LPLSNREKAMTHTRQLLDDSLEILLGELITDEELRDSFIQNPERTLQLAGDWGLPLSASELQSLRMHADRLLERVAEELTWRVLAAA
jgi:hypothetical protein